jgi:hypothetical protein
MKDARRASGYFPIRYTVACRDRARGRVIVSFGAAIVDGLVLFVGIRTLRRHRAAISAVA